MNLIELKATTAALKKQLYEYERITPACNNCEKLGTDKSCNQFLAKPPDEWLTGPVECQEWQYDNIPL